MNKQEKFTVLIKNPTLQFCISFNPTNRDHNFFNLILYNLKTNVN